MRVAMIGAVAFTRRCLEAVVAARGDVVGLLTLDPEGGRKHGDYVDLAPIAVALGVPLHRVRDVNDAPTIELLHALAPDVIFVFGWSQLLGPELLALAPCIGSHPAPLPHGRGRHPITWTLVDGDPETGLTFLWLDNGADTGDILWQRRFPVEPDDDAATLYAKMEELATVAVREFLPQLETGRAPRIPQDDALATVRRKRTEDDRIIEWGAPSLAIHNLVRGLARPYIGAVTRRGGQDVLVWKTRIPPDPLPEEALSAPPGTIVADRSDIAVRTGDGHVILAEVELVGELRAGDVLGDAS